MTDFIPCPFCGKHGAVAFHDGNRIFPWSVDCRYCGTSGPRAMTEWKAIELWNRRVKAIELWNRRVKE